MNYKKLNLFALSLLLLWVVTSLPALSQASKPNLQQLKIFHLKDKSQEERLDKYLQNAYLPALHRAGISKVGVFKPVENTNSSAPAPTEQLVYVLFPLSSPDQVYKLDETLAKDKQYTAAAKDYIDAPHNSPLYSHFETILLDAFVGMKGVSAPKLKSAPQERIYELRSYEAASEKLHQNKVDMFNKGEIQLFDRLGFNAVFYGRVIAGSKMPNLMYMTSFENMAEREKHWNAFRDDPEWKKMSKMPEYANNVSRSDIYLLHPTSYSDI